MVSAKVVLDTVQMSPEDAGFYDRVFSQFKNLLMPLFLKKGLFSSGFFKR